MIEQQEAPRLQIPEVLKKSHEYAVIMPYSSNLTRSASGQPEPRLSFYSAFVTNAALELYRSGRIKKLILCGETTFGKGRKTTSDLMKQALIRQSVVNEDIVSLQDPKLNNTALQIKAVAKYQRRQHLQHNSFLIIDWGFHDERVRNHIRGFRLKADTVQAEDLHKYFVPHFNLAQLQRILPKEFEEREKTPRLLSKFDKRGLIPRLIEILRGPSVTDIKKDYSTTYFSPKTRRPLPSLRLINTSGKKLLALDKK